MKKPQPRPDRAALFVRLTAKEKAYLAAEARRAGFSNVSEWLRVTKLKQELSLANA